MHELDLKKLTPIHPWYTLKKIILKEMAEKTGIDYVILARLMQGRGRITDELAEKLTTAFGWKKSFWVNLQENYSKVFSWVRCWECKQDCMNTEKPFIVRCMHCHKDYDLDIPSEEEFND